MAPKRKQDTSDEAPKTDAVTTRVTRSSNRLAAAGSSNPAAEPEQPKKKKAKSKSPSQTQLGDEEKDTGASKTVVIEHCTQCSSFKTRATQVKDGLEKEVPGVTVSVNPEKPRRGCFEIREEDGEVFVSLLDLKRPFSPMKKLDMDKVVSDIVEKIK